MRKEWAKICAQHLTKHPLPCSETKHSLFWFKCLRGRSCDRNSKWKTMAPFYFVKGDEYSRVSTIKITKVESWETEKLSKNYWLSNLWTPQHSTINHIEQQMIVHNILRRSDPPVLLVFAKSMKSKVRFFPQKRVSLRICTSVFVFKIFIIAKIQNQPRCQEQIKG